MPRRGPHSSPSKRGRDARAKKAADVEPLWTVREPVLRPHSERASAEEKREERRRHAARMDRDMDGIVAVETLTRHAMSDALKAESLCVNVGGCQLLRDTNLVVSEQVSAYGLVGPNGCGKTTLLRAIAGAFGKDSQLPMPKSWGDPYLVDQLEPAPTGLSPVEEVLSSCVERSKLMLEERGVLDELDRLDARVSSEEPLSEEEKISLQDLSDRHENIVEQLARFDSAEREVRGILSALGFCAGECGDDGAPSMDKKDEFIVCTEGLQVGSHVEVRDSTDEPWQRGAVTCLEPLQVQPEGWERSFSWHEFRHAQELSGGWRKKVSLAKALWLKPKLLLLDEPTNHLDFAARLWFQRKLLDYPHTLVIVSHDPCFLSYVCQKFLHIADRSIQTLESDKVTVDDLVRMQQAERRRLWHFAYPMEGVRRGKRQQAALSGLSFHHVDFSYTPQTAPVLRDVHRDVVRFSNRSRAVILGRNGSGKSTLVKLCLGLLEPTAGEIDKDCAIGHFSQHFHEVLEAEAVTSAMYLVEHCAKELQQRCGHSGKDRLHEAACSILNDFGLDAKVSTQTSVADLSGGQKARVNFAYLSLKPCQLLILDEPTNHLDAEGMHHLAEAICHFPGGIVLVSHDEYLIWRILSSGGRDGSDAALLLCQDGRVQALPGSQGLDEYRRKACREQYEREERELAAQRVPPPRPCKQRRSRPARQDSLPSTREPTPEPSGTDAKPVSILHSMFKTKRSKPKPMNFNALQ